MDDLRQQVAALARRVQALENELAVHRQIVRYGFAVDTGDADGAAALFTEDAVYDVDGPLLMRGRDGVRRRWCAVPGTRRCSRAARTRSALPWSRSTATARRRSGTRASTCAARRGSRSTA